ncbi:MAG: hypothetical protein LW722_07250 [Rubrivivax sp.]|jgi:alcohol dehydrogenase (cytochrome c)|nr:hypothetical protein [Rubrivivax sp.]
MSHSRLPRRLVATLLALAAAPLAAQSLADLRNDAATPGNVTTYGMGWAQHRHAGGKQITPANARRLVPVWNLSLDNSAKPARSRW